MESSEFNILQRIDSKLGALLVLGLLEHLPENAPARKRTMDQALRDAGLDVGDIAALLGKSHQAVYKQLNESKSSTTKSRKAAKK